MPVPTALLTASERSGSDTSRPASHRTNCTSSTITRGADDDGPAEAVHGTAAVGASTMPTVAATAAPATAPRRMAAVMSCHCQKRYWSSRLVTSDRLSASPPLACAPGSALPGSWSVLVMMAIESDRLRPAPSACPSSSAWCVRSTAVRKIDRKVSVLMPASTASSKAGRKFTACWLPSRASCSVRVVAISWRTVDESSSATTRSLNVSLS